MEGVRPCLPMLHSRDPARPRFREPLNVWRQWSCMAKSLMNIGALLNQGKPADPNDWHAYRYACRNVTPTGLETEERDVSKGRADLAWELDCWLSMGQVRPLIDWVKKNERWQFRLDRMTSGPNLFGLLALNLALAISGTELAVCGSRGQSYLPKRRPDPNRRNYCTSCGERVAQRDASRAYRRRRKLVMT